MTTERVILRTHPPMSVTLVPSSVTIDRSGPSWLVESTGYEILAELPRSPRALENSRADLQVGIPRSAQSLAHMVVIKRFHTEPPESDWLALVAELEFASALRHDNVVRTLGIGLEAGRYFSIQQYLDGATLEACLAWAAATRTRFGTPVVARILLGILDAVKHASLLATFGLSQALARSSVAAEDVFLSYDGQVKLLGFKGRHGGKPPAPSAVDALLEQQLTLELRRVLPRWIRSVRDPARDPAQQIREALSGAGVPASDGRAELCRALRHVQRKEQAQRALLFAKSFSRLRGPVRRASALTGEEEAPPQSGLRGISVVPPGVPPGVRPGAGPQPFGMTQPFALLRPARRG